jgi:hypothetical protein
MALKKRLIPSEVEGRTVAFQLNVIAPRHDGAQRMC